ncbi:hypothetical protein [Bifidobacterium asteroides]|uniref:hypothetical protein n=1 Tax=Bifidobacterium TaxID=1678 RepID=UPI0015E8E7E0|nr:hypothetical protein [Bifidobacterium asteroides]
MLVFVFCMGLAASLPGRFLLCWPQYRFLLARVRPSFGLFGNGRLALKFGRQKINIHEAGHEIDPKSDKSAPGSADLCLLVEDSLDDVVAALHEHHVEYLGPVNRTGAHGAITSVCVRNPDRNLIELSSTTRTDTRQEPDTSARASLRLDSLSRWFDKCSLDFVFLFIFRVASQRFPGLCLFAGVFYSNLPS